MKVLTDNKYYGQIADIVREQTGTNNTYKPSQMVNTLKDLFYEEVEGVPPITFQGIGENLLDYRIDGNSSENLFDEIYTGITEGLTTKYSELSVPNGQYTLSTSIPSSSVANLFLCTTEDPTPDTANNGVYNGHPKTVTVNDQRLFIFYRALNADPRDYHTMLNAGSTALPYAPYGGGVGDRTENLFDEELAQGYYSDIASSSNDLISSSIRVAGTTFIPVSTGNKITLTYESAIGITKYLVYYYNNNKELINVVGWYISGSTITIPNNISFIRFVWGAKEDWSNSYSYVTLLVTNISNIMLNSGSTALPYEPYGYKVPVKILGKNLFDEANAVVTDYYITNEGQEAVGTNGDKFLKSYINVNPSTEYTFKWSQTIMGSSNNSPYIRISEYTSNNTFIQRILCKSSEQSQNNYTFTTSNNTVYIDLRIDAETSTRGQHFTEIMLVKGATAPDTYEEYIETEANIYIDSQINENESVSLSDTNINIPTLRGTNILAVETTVQPSKIYVKSRKESQHEIAMRQDYEEQLSDIETELQGV